MLHNLVISGGSVKIVAIIGCLKYLEENGFLRLVQTFVGTSAGAILCLAMTLGFNTDEIVEFLQKDVYEAKLHCLDLDQLYTLNFMESWGLDSGKTLTALLEALLKKKGLTPNTTFMDLAKCTGKHLVVCVANLSKSETEYFSVDSYPNVPVVEAVRMSCSLPFLFTPVLFNECYYVDGGIYESLPVKYIEQTFKDTLRDTLAINVVEKPYPHIADISQYTTMLIRSIVDKANAHECNDTKIRRIDVEFDEEGISFSLDTLSFELDEEKISNFISKGYELMKYHFSKST